METKRADRGQKVWIGVFPVEHLHETLAHKLQKIMTAKMREGGARLDLLRPDLVHLGDREPILLVVHDNLVGLQDSLKTRGVE